jgi:L-cysteine S-thiosulfotransferase
MKRCFSGLARLLYVVCFGLFAAFIPAGAANLTPEQERQALLQTLQQRFPLVTPSAYVTGSAAFGDAPEPSQIDPNRYAEIMAKGKSLWERRFRNGRSLASCFPNGGRRVAATYPQFDSRTRHVITFETAINQCLRLHGEREIDISDSDTGGALTTYARSLADDQRTNVRVKTPLAQAKFEAGRALFLSRMGQKNQACASCHIQYAGSIMRDRSLPAAIGQTAQWPRIDDQGKVKTLQMQYQRCMQRIGASPLQLGSEELNNLEYFHTFLSNGLPLKALPGR